MESKLSLSELNLLIKDALLDAFPDTIWIVAEISELKVNRSGHCYLELIEKENGSNEIIARSRATIWSYTFRMLRPYFETITGKEFSAGIKILVQVAVEYHEAFGLSLNIKDIDPTYTLGDLARQRQEILNRLVDDGVYDMNKELPLPLVPQNIAVISSATAAGYQDFVQQLENNDYGFMFNHKLFEAYMQGNEAVPTIINALERIFNYEEFFDVVVIIRGGGSQADLSCFDNYELAYNITQFPLPVITGIGHEKDDTIIDMVAHTRMKTPTAVAEFLIAGVARFYEKLLDLENHITDRAKEIIRDETERLEQYSTVIVHFGQKYLEKRKIQLNKFGNDLRNVVNKFTGSNSRKLDSITYSLKNQKTVFFLNKENVLINYSLYIQNTKGRMVQQNHDLLQHYQENLKIKLHHFFHKESEQIHLSEKSLMLLDPQNILERGYTITMKNGQIIKSREKVALEDEIETRFFDGSVKSKIIKK